MTNSKLKTSYKDSGVDIAAGDALVEHIKPLSKSTNRVGVMQGLGGFGCLFDIKACGYDDPILVSGTDGVGTKLLLALDMNDFSSIGIDLVAMCVNDIIVQGADPLFFLDYYATGKLEQNQAQSVIASIADGCAQANAALIGGETAELPSLYQHGHFDLAGFCVGAVERENLLPKQNIQQGDVMIGISSSGFHSNGFSLVRHICAHHQLDYHAPCPYDSDKTLGEALLTPTAIYVSLIQKLLPAFPIKALAHITGGGLIDNPGRVLPRNVKPNIDFTAWDLPPAFQWIDRLADIEQQSFYQTFNCGIGMVVYIDKKYADKIIEIIQQFGYDAYVIGDVINSE